MEKFIISLVGRPNVGKSTLFNRLTRSRDAIVDSTPGLTRDRRYGKLNFDDFSADIVDTGGLDFQKDIISSLIASQTQKAIIESNLILFLVDAIDGVTRTDLDIAKILRTFEKDIILVVNKADNNKILMNTNDFFDIGFENIVNISAEHGIGVGALKEIIENYIKNYLASLKKQDEAEDFEESEDDETEDFSDFEDEIEIIKDEEDEKGFKFQDDTIRITLAGRPNVGKSSLVNKIIGDERMVVSDIPGTTRDAIDTLFETNINHKPYKIILTDTAGIRRRARVDEKIEKISIIKSQEAIKKSDITIILMDPMEGITDQDKKIISIVGENYKGLITVFNKWDLLKEDKDLKKLRETELKYDTKFVSYAPHINISSKTGFNVKKLFPMIVDIYSQFTTRINTGKANSILKEAMSRKSPPMSAGHTIKLFYTTQTHIKPPTFLIFCNYPELLQEHYKRYLANFFREKLSLDNTPIKFIWRKREREK
jgi:GTP-binding protein